MSCTVQLCVIDRTINQEILVPYSLRVVPGQGYVPHCVGVYLCVLASDIEF